MHKMRHTRVPLAQPARVLGACAGKAIMSVVTAPRQARVKLLLPVLGIGMPLLTGVVDIYLRMSTA